MMSRNRPLCQVGSGSKNCRFSGYIIYERLLICMITLVECQAKQHINSAFNNGTMDLLAMRRYLSPSTTSTLSSALSINNNSNEIRSINDKSILLHEHQQKIFIQRMNCTRQFTENCQRGMFPSSGDYNQNCTNNRDNYDNCLANNQTNTLSQILVAPTTLTDVINSSITDTNEDFNSFYFYETEQFTVLWVLFAVIVLGNSAVLVTMFLNKSQKSRMNFFIKQLALADLCVGLLSVLTDIIWRITVSWRAGNIACKCIRFIQACVTYASTYVLVALSIDRYDAITNPMNFSGSWRRARRLVAIAWLLSAVFSLPMVILYEEKVIQDQTQCWIDLGSPSRWQIYMSLVAATLFVFPAIIIAACYAIIVRTIWAKGSLLMSDRRGAVGTDRGSRRASSRGIIPRAKIKTVKMTFVIVIVFIVCWSPYIIFDLLQVYEKIPKTQTSIAIASFIQSLAPLNSAANPLIYCLFSTQVCRTLRRTPPFRWLNSTWCCKNRKSSTMNSHSSSTQNGHGRHLRNSTDSMRTLTTSVTAKRTTSCIRPARVVILERPKSILAMSEV